MTSMVNQKLLALCGVAHGKDSAYTPRHQRPVEWDHLAQMTNQLSLLDEVCAAFPTEWLSLLPIL